jgi:peptidoglycan DL-endopeptidase CwlO
MDGRGNVRAGWMSGQTESRTEGSQPVRLARLRAGLSVSLAIGAAVSATVAAVVAAQPGANSGAAGRNAAAAVSRRGYANLLGSVGIKPAGDAVAEAAAARARIGGTETAAAQQEGVTLPTGGVLLPAVGGAGAPTGPVVTASPSGAHLGPLGPLYTADLLVLAPRTLPAGTVAAIGKLPGVVADNVVDAARVEVNGGSVATLGVDPGSFREFAEQPTAASTTLWENVAAGDIVVSYLMGQQENLPLGGSVAVTGTRTENLPVGGFGTVGINGVDAVVSDSVARSLGMPAGNGLVVSAPQARLSDLMAEMKQVLPTGTAIAPLVAQAALPVAQPSTSGLAGGVGITAADGPGLTVSQTRAFLAAALSRVGMPYVWGGAGPDVFDCSGLVQWSMRQAGIVMPRVAAQQAETGPSIPGAQLQPGDLLFYHTDPTAPDYISHVAIYLGGGMMEQAPEPGMDVEVVPADFGSGFAGAVRVYPAVAAAVAG